MGIGEKWMRWTLLEAGTKTASKLLGKLIGNVSASQPHLYLATLVIGMVQVVAGYLGARQKMWACGRTSWAFLVLACLGWWQWW